MINLKDIDNGPLPSDEDLFQYISDYDIFKYYIGDDLPIGRVMKSPLREDNYPSFSIFRSSKPGSPLLFKDFGTGLSGGAVRFVQLLYDIGYREAIDTIIIDFRLTSKLPTSHKREPKRAIPRIHKTYEIPSFEKKNHIDVNIRQWTLDDKHFWYDRYGISKELLKQYNVYPISYIYLNDKVFKAEKLAYVYIENKDEIKRYKIYQPKSKWMKWVNNFVKGTISGFSQLPETGDLLFIASSLKDGLVLKSLGYEFIAPQTEGYIFNPKVMNDLKQRFKKIVIFYDADNAGITATHKMRDIYGLDYIFTDEFIKDISDYREIKGEENTIKLIENELCKLDKPRF